MHERNIYRSRPKFRDLGKKYDFLAPFVLNEKGDYSIDFQDPKALRALAKALLLEDFNLNVEFPEEMLVPRIPSRLDYILWIEDLIEYYDCNRNEVVGIDIGTGPSSIYALLGARKNKWSMIATEAEEEPFKCAVENVERNDEQGLIKVMKVTGEAVFADIDCMLKGKKLTFTMCNPPYFAEDEDIGKRRNNQCSTPSGGQTGIKSELSTQGGEVHFITKMIRESQLYAHNIMIFTSMVGVLRHMKYIKQEFWRLGIANFLTDEITCGKTTRWFIAWSFEENILLAPKDSDISNHIENIPKWVDLENVILGFLTEINISGKRVKCCYGWVIHIVAYENLWTNQRKRRRERMNKALNSAPDESPSKRTKGSTDEDVTSELTSTTDESPVTITTSQSEPDNVLPCETKKPLLDIIIRVVQLAERNDAYVQLTYRGGILGKNGLHQFNQYLRNRYAEKAKSLQQNLGTNEALSLTMRTD